MLTSGDGFKLCTQRHEYDKHSCVIEIMAHASEISCWISDPISRV